MVSTETRNLAENRITRRNFFSGAIALPAPILFAYSSNVFPRAIFPTTGLLLVVDFEDLIFDFVMMGVVLGNVASGFDEAAR